MAKKKKRKARGHRRSGQQLRSALEAYCFDRLKDSKLKFSTWWMDLDTQGCITR